MAFKRAILAFHLVIFGFVFQEGNAKGPTIGPQPAPGCICGEQCEILGVHGVCQADGQTCADNIQPPNCPGCICGEQCEMLGGGTAVCQADCQTCAHNKRPPICSGCPEGNAKEETEDVSHLFQQVGCSTGIWSLKPCDCWPAQDWQPGAYPSPKHCWKRCRFWQNFIWGKIPGSFNGKCKCVSTVANCKTVQDIANQYLYQVLHGYN